MVETIAECEVTCGDKSNSTNSSQNIPVIFIEDREEVNDQIIDGLAHYSPSVRIVTVAKPTDVSGFGFLLSRSKWDPYPYISRIDEDSPASASGLKEGDCVLEVNGTLVARELE
jgi:S1-C subfamily serine protease